MGNRTNSSVRAIVNVFFLLLIALLGWGCASAPVASSPAEPALESTIFEYKRADDELLMWFFFLEDDDRSGDAILVMLPNGETMLIDAGIEAAGSQLKHHLDRLGVTHLDYAVATHAHNDHIGGFLPLFGSVTMDDYVTVNVPHSTDTYARVMRGLGESEIPITYVEAGERFSLPGGVEVLVLNPPAGTTGDDVPPGSDAAGLNNLSLVFRLDYGEVSFLFTADIYRARESALIDTYGDVLDVDVVKVPHHGESTSSSSSFVDAMSPEYAVITINILQSLPIYQRYGKSGAQAFITGIDGTVLLICDGSSIAVHAEHPRDSDSLF